VLENLMTWLSWELSFERAHEYQETMDWEARTPDPPPQYLQLLTHTLSHSAAKTPTSQILIFPPAVAFCQGAQTHRCDDTHMSNFIETRSICIDEQDLIERETIFFLCQSFEKMFLEGKHRLK